MKFLLIALVLFLDSSLGSDNDSAWISKMKNFLASELNSFESDFIQKDSFGNPSEGKLFLKANKGKMKLRYSSPNPNVITVKNFKMTHYNRELKERTEISVYSSPFSFLLDKKLDFDKNVKVLSIEEIADEVEIKLCKNDDETEGAIILIFSKNPFRLVRWIVLEKKDDDYSRQTMIILENSNYKSQFSDKVFESFS